MLQQPRAFETLRHFPNALESRLQAVRCRTHRATPSATGAFPAPLDRATFNSELEASLFGGYGWMDDRHGQSLDGDSFCRGFDAPNGITG